MPRIPIVGRRVGAFGFALTVWDVWHRLPPHQRQQLMDQARKHGPRLAKQAVEAGRARTRRP
jgi:hypothetical protein